MKKQRIAEMRSRGEDTEDMYGIDDSILRRNRVQPMTDRDAKNQKRISYEA